MTQQELDAMPKALRLLAEQINAPDHIPAMCLRDAAAMIESLRFQRNRLAEALRFYAAHMKLGYNITDSGQVAEEALAAVKGETKP